MYCTLRKEIKELLFYLAEQETMKSSDMMSFNTQTQLLEVNYKNCIQCLLGYFNKPAN